MRKIIFGAILAMMPFTTATEARDLGKQDYQVLAALEQVRSSPSVGFEVSQQSPTPRLRLAATTSNTITVNTDFVLPTGHVLHYIAPNGNDHCNGTSSAIGTLGNCAWLTPNHAISCGDVIIAAAGNYTNQFQGVHGAGSNWSQPSNCPSTTGGIDGKGGVYFAIVLCAGPYISSCNVNGGAGDAFHWGGWGIAKSPSNWAVEGFYVSQNVNAADTACFLASSTKTYGHHIAWVNNIANQCSLAGFTTGGQKGYGYDFVAAVGNIAFNAARSAQHAGYCGSGFSLIPSTSGAAAADLGNTHVYVGGNFAYNNYNDNSNGNCPVTGANTDGEGFIFDSLAAQSPAGTGGYQYQAVIEQNVGWINGSSCIQIFPQGNGTTNDRAQYYITRNSCYGNYTDVRHNGGGGEFYYAGTYPTGIGYYSTTNNLAVADKIQNPPPGGGNISIVTAFDYWCNINCSTPHSFQITSGNYFWNSTVPTTTGPGHCNSSEPYTAYTACSQSPARWTMGDGTDVFNNPGFASPTSLPTALQPPACANYVTTTDCMNDPSGFNVWGHLTPTTPGAVGKGYTPPPTGCGGTTLVGGPADGKKAFPTWLKGIVTLHWTGTKVVQIAGQLDMPCGL
jgi:hypothetical protein